MIFSVKVVYLVSVIFKKQQTSIAIILISLPGLEPKEDFGKGIYNLRLLSENSG